MQDDEAVEDRKRGGTLKGNHFVRRSHILHPEYASLAQKTIVIVGCGGTGCLAATLLARMGTRRLVLIDRDLVEETNLERQVAFGMQDLGRPKAAVLGEQLKSYAAVTVHVADLDHRNVSSCIGPAADLVIDCTDNILTRLVLNDYCRQQHIPLLYCGAIEERGSLYLMIPGRACLSCFLAGKEGDSCARAGVTPACVSFMASLAVQVACDFLCLGKSREDLLFFTFSTMKTSFLRVTRRKGCPACGGRYLYLEGKGAQDVLTFCSDGRYQFLADETLDVERIKEKLLSQGRGVEQDGIVRWERGVLFSDGRALINAKSREEAKRIYTEQIRA